MAKQLLLFPVLLMFHSIILVAGVRGVWTYWMGGSGRTRTPLPGEGVMSQVSIIRRTNVPLQRHFPSPPPVPGRYNTSSDDLIMDKDIHAV